MRLVMLRDRPAFHATSRGDVRAGRAVRAMSLLVAMIGLSGPVRADEVEAYLERLGLDALLVLHLEDRLVDAPPERVDRIAARIGDLYADLLDRSDDPALQARYAARLEALLAGPLQRSGPELRIPLLRIRFRVAEEIAERERMDLCTAEERTDAIRNLRDLERELTAIEPALAARVESQLNRLARSGISDAITLEAEAGRLQGRLRQAMFLAAWTQYHLARLEGRAQDAQSAERRFARLLDVDERQPVPEQVSRVLRGEESFARTILGMALTKTLTASAATALAWVELLVVEETWAPLRGQAAAWRIVVLLECREFDEAEREIRREQASDRVVAPMILRLAASRGLRAEASAAATRLLGTALASLAHDGEFAILHGLARRYGTGRLAIGGFAGPYVLGSLAARRGDEAAESGSDAEARAAREEARARLTEALAHADAVRFPDAALDGRRLLGWVHYALGRYDAAVEQFLEVASLDQGERGRESLWMAVVSAEQVLLASGSEDARSAFDHLAERFVARYPDDSRAVTAMMRRAVHAPVPSESLARELLAVDENHPASAASQRTAADILFTLMRREEDAAERARLADRFLQVAQPLFLRDAARTHPEDGPRVEALAALGLRLLEVTLSSDVRRLPEARAVLAAMEAHVADGTGARRAWADELVYRRIRERLWSGAFNEALAMADRMAVDDPESRWAAASDRLLFMEAERAWREQRDDDDRMYAVVVARSGDRLAAIIGREDPTLERPDNLAIRTRAAEAWLELFLHRDDDGSRARAKALFEELLQLHPRSRPLLRGMALVEERGGDPARALALWHTLLTALPDGSDDWFEARTHHLEVLARIDPGRAARSMAQHVAFHPEYGPEPWRARLLHLAATLPPVDGAPPADAMEAPDA